MTRTEHHEAPDGRRFKVGLGSCLCDPCWQARCQCGVVLTKHAFTREDAHGEALDVLSRKSAAHFGHPACIR